MDNEIDNKTDNNLQRPVVQITNPNKGFHYIYALSLIYVLSIYLVPVIISILISMDKDVAYSLFLIPIIIGIANFIISIKCCKPGNRIVLLNAAVLIKYALIPFFIINGFASVVFALSTFIPVPFMIFVAPIASLGVAVAGWFVLVLGAPYPISYLCVSAKEKLRSKGMVIIYSLLQFFFVFDVIAVMVMTLKERKWKKLTITIIILLIILILLTIILLGLGIKGIMNR